MSKRKILVTGANGQLGRELFSLSAIHPEFDFAFRSKEHLPIHDRDIVDQTFTELNPDYCINCAAYTAVDRAELEQDTAFLINGESTGILAEACSNLNVKLIHISTDYVFNGQAVLPYRETDPVDPVNVYGASKLKGEKLAMAKNGQSIIIRTSWVYSEYGNNFVKTMIRLMKERQYLGIVNDQHGSPTYAADLAKVIISIISSEEWKHGIYHYSNDGVITWYEFANAIKSLTKSDCKINPITTAAFPTPAKRPSYSVFDKEKIQMGYGIVIPGWEKSLEACLKRLQNL